MGALRDLSGQKIGKVLVIGRSPMPGRDGRPAWNVRCDCGNDTVITSEQVRNGNKTCGCSGHSRPGAKIGERLDLVGKRFGRLTVLAPAERIKTRAFTWQCGCDCGAVKNIRTSCLRDGSTVSCGCHRIEKTVARRKHGGYAKDAPDLAKTWSGMKQRCFNPNSENYRLYGGRGITICDRWLYGDDGLTGLECFIADMGPKPTPEHTVDRWPDNDGDYEPSNCRWATMAEQNLNKRSNGVRVPPEERTVA